ncbi:hypothetical protein IWQ49_000907 [Labrenzia sp. EL_126]|nr:hypothetical protein [Labrenzia sp. EL_126]
MLAVIAHWRKIHDEDFAVVHDATANFFRHRNLWERITNTDVPDQSHRLGDGSDVEFPLRVVSTAAVDSRENRSIQFCDVLAGLVARHFDPRTEGDDRKLIDDVIEAGLGCLDYNGIRPSFVWPDEIPPRRLSGPDAVDRMTQMIFGAHNSGRPAV